MDEDGYFFIVDRKKDMIIAGGYNIYPREVEEVLFEHPKVMEAVAVGVPDEYRGETVKAFVVLEAGRGRATEEEIIAFCRERLAPYKVPRACGVPDRAAQDHGGQGAAAGPARGGDSPVGSGGQARGVGREVLPP